MPPKPRALRSMSCASDWWIAQWAVLNVTSGLRRDEVSAAPLPDASRRLARRPRAHRTAEGTAVDALRASAARAGWELDVAGPRSRRGCGRRSPAVAGFGQTPPGACPDRRRWRAGHDH